MQADLFYPKAAGWREPTTSKDAATAIETSGRASILRERIKAFFSAGHTATADEVAAILKEPVLSCRPRVAELHKQGFITQTGARRKSSGGKPSHVWRRASADQT